MATELNRFSDAYATMTVAFYQPLTIRWVSLSTLGLTADLVATRLVKARATRGGGGLPTAAKLRVARQSRLPDRIPQAAGSARLPPPRPVDPAGRFLKESVRPVQLDGFPDAVEVAGRVYPYGVVDVDEPPSTAGRTGLLSRLFSRALPQRPGSVRAGALTIPTMVRRRLGFVDRRESFHQHRRSLIASLDAAVAANIDAPDTALAEAVRDSLVLDDVRLHDFFPILTVREALSPIGIAHFYRQLYFHTEEGVGPIEEAFTVAPNETLEVTYESVRRQVHEELIEQGSELVSESAVEARNTDEVSDKASAMIQRDTSASMSANASGSVGVYSGGASATASFSVSAQRGREQTARRLKEVTRRASERITKSFKVQTRSLEEVTTTNISRRIISNPGPTPVNFGLRRVLRKVNVKVQELGPRLVWQLYLRNPGTGLARSRFVHFREAEPIAVPDIPPGVRPRPKGGTDTGTTNATLLPVDADRYAAKLLITTTPDRMITGVTVDSVTDLEGGGKDDDAPSPLNELPQNTHWDPATNTFSAEVLIERGDSDAVSVGYTYSYEPSAEAMDEWDAERKAAIQTLDEQRLTEQFEREKAIITERSKIRPRPANELRREERYEAMNRLVSNLFGRGDDPSEPTPLEIEYFHRYFDIDAMFVFMHPSWWRPRFTAGSDGFPRPAYEITAESDPAPLGSSLGWLVQLDGDNRRNEFLNSPWYRICLPMRQGREREAVEWLAKHVEGDRGYDPQRQPLKGLLEAIEEREAVEERLGLDGPDWVTVEASPGAPEEPASPQGVFPVIDEFEVTVPTDGFVYDELTIAT